MAGLKVIADTSWFRDRSSGNQRLEIEEISGENWKHLLRGIGRYLRFDVAIMNSRSPVFFMLSFFKLLVPFSKIKIISVDLILSKPETAKDFLISLGKRFMLKGVDHFLLYMKDTEGYQRYYGIDKRKINYLPFKINSYDYVMSRKIEDHGYLLAGGVSKRDYDTLLEAVRGLKYQVVVLVPPNALSEMHGTKISSERLPPNVAIVHDDGSPESWVDYMSRAKMIILPIKKNTISPSGISTYLTAMALHKCVIASEGPATRGVIPEGAAVIVPPGDVKHLQQAIIKCCEDDGFREGVASKGYNYAISLKDHERLIGDIVTFVAGITRNAELDYGRLH
jgi:glycosyltransferase involved in cell wall biosynthesis